MFAFGAVVGLLFHPFTDLIPGVDADMMPVLFMLCVAAGVVVGSVNFVLLDVVVSREISSPVAGMEYMNTAVANTEDTREECRRPS